MIDDLKQTELDIFEQKLLDDVFGGHEEQNMCIKKGFFELNLADNVQSCLDKLEQMVIPLMDDHGYIIGSEIKKYLSGQWKNIIPEGRFRLIEIYSQVSPMIKKIAGGLIK